jgi:hypothetical protein
MGGEVRWEGTATGTAHPLENTALGGAARGAGAGQSWCWTSCRPPTELVLDILSPSDGCRGCACARACVRGTRLADKTLSEVEM